MGFKPGPLQAQVLDPTTYVPAIVHYIAMTQDWKTSQVFFEHGWYEVNPDFTIDGRSPGLPVSHARGMAKIRGRAATTLLTSVMNNSGVAVLEHLLVSRFPMHVKLIRIVSWTERILFASFLSYQMSHLHIRQVGINKRTAACHEKLSWPINGTPLCR